MFVGSAAAVTTAVAGDSATAVPALLDPVTSTLNVWPTSALTTARVWPVAPEMSVQLAPLVLHRCHW